MKKLLLLILPLLAITFNSCSSDKDKGEDVTDNTFIINGRIYEITGGSMDYFGHYYSESTENITLWLYSQDNPELIGIDMHITNGNTKLVAGTYSLNDNYAAFTYSEGWIEIGNDEFDITSGTVTVSVSGNTYTININCNLNNAGTVKGTYKGALRWVDESE